MTCSQLSRTSSAGRASSADTIDSVNVRPRISFTPSTSATARGTSLDEPCSASSTSHAPPPSRCAAATASRVLPMPPGPTSVTSGARSSACWTTARSRSRPINRPRRRGRFPRRVSSVRNGGCSSSPSWKMRCSTDDTLEAERPEVAQVASIDQRRRQPRHQHLAAVGCGGKPGGDDHRRPEVALASLLGLTGVHADPDARGRRHRATAAERSPSAPRSPTTRRRGRDGRRRRTSHRRWRRRSRHDDRRRS